MKKRAGQWCMFERQNRVRPPSLGFKTQSRLDSSPKTD
jgi:hypothetical protein